jgi:hypothetical protein
LLDGIVLQDRRGAGKIHIMTKPGDDAGATPEIYLNE